MVIGGHRSGKSGMLATLLAADRAGATVMVPRDHEGAWDVLTGQLDAVRAADPVARLLLLDDLDALIGSYQEEYAHALVEVVAALLREGGRVGVHLVITARRLGSSMQQVAALCDSRLVLRLPNKQEHVLAGGDAADFDPELQPGGGYWRGDRVQLAVAPTSDARHPEHGAESADIPDWSLWPGWIVVAAHPGELSRRLGRGSGSEASSGRMTGLPGGWELVEPGVRPIADAAAFSVGRPGEGRPGEDRVFVADPETWQAQWSLFGSLRMTMPILFDGCGPAEFRALTRLRTLPPPIAPSSDAAWLLTPDGVLERVRPPWVADGA